MLAVDVNGDGKPDIYVCNDTVDNFLYINHCTPGHFLFEEVGVKSGTARDDRGAANGSMGCDAGRLRRLRPAVDLGDELRGRAARPLPQRLQARRRDLFYHRTAASGIGAIGQKYVAWGTAFLDLDHDGWEDIFIADGHAIHFPTKPGSSRRQKPVLLRNQGDGKFKNLSARGGPYFEKDHLSRGVGFGDLDNDGRIDVVVSQLTSRLRCCRTWPTGGRHALAGRSSWSARATPTWWGRRCAWRPAAGRRRASPRAAAATPRRATVVIVFGLGKADKVGKVTVTWPNLQEQTWAGDALPVDHYYRLTQGKTAPEKTRDD